MALHAALAGLQWARFRYWKQAIQLYSPSNGCHFRGRFGLQLPHVVVERGLKLSLFLRRHRAHQFTRQRCGLPPGVPLNQAHRYGYQQNSSDDHVQPGRRGLGVPGRPLPLTAELHLLQIRRTESRFVSVAFHTAPQGVLQPF